MYPVSNDFKTYIKKNTVSYSWHGILTDKNGDTYNITDENIVESSSKITRKIGNDKLSIGTTGSAELELNLYLDVNRYIMLGGTIELFFTLDIGEDTEDVPMGTYIIAESNQSSGQLNLLAYDVMTRFDDKNFSPTLNNEIRQPYDWLIEMCNDCNVTLGIPKSQVEDLPNGNRKTGFADVVTNAKTWRDVLGYLCAYLGGYAYIGRDSKLYIGQYKKTSIDTISPSFRYSSELSDFRTTFDGLYATYKDEGIQEYVSNANTDGLILNLNTNPFLQFVNSGNRQDALKEIIDSWNDVYYVPYEVTMPIVPYYDPGDVISFTGNQAGQYDVGAIVEVIYNIGGQMSIRCFGDNPILTEAQDRFTKSVAGLNSQYNNGQETGGKNFWLLHTENDSALTVSNTKTLVAQLDWKQTVDVQRMGFMYTCEAELSATATVNILITVDDEEDYEFDVEEEKSMKGKRILNSTCGFRVTDKGTHSAKVYMTVVDTPTKWSDLV